MIEKIYSEDFKSKVLDSGRTVVVDFFAEWCGPCKMLAPVLDELARENPDVDFYKINTDENLDLAAEYNVSSIPNILIFKNGEFVENSIGYKSKEELQALIRSV